MEKKSVLRMNGTNIAWIRLFPIAMAALLMAGSVSEVIAQDPPFGVLEGLFDQSNTVDLGLDPAEGTETFPVFRPSDSTDHFSNGVVLVPFMDTLYCMWQSSATDEDAPDTRVVFSRSGNGVSWSEPEVLAPSIPDGYCSSGGWWVNSDTLVAYVNVWPSSVSPRGGYAYYAFSTDGRSWSPIQPVRMDGGDTLKGIFEQDPRALPGGRILGAAHFQPGLVVSPIYTDDPSGVRGWKRSTFENLSVSGSVSRELEPSWYRRADGNLVMTFRDQSGSYRRLAALSADNGETWTNAALTDMPDSRSKQSAGNLPGGEAFLVGNPVDDRTRIPLAIALSEDGTFFNTAYILRTGDEDLQELRYEGQYKRAGYHYPKSVIWGDHMYVSYSVNKEDVEYTRVPLASLVIDTLATGTGSAERSVQELFTLAPAYPNPCSAQANIRYRLTRPGMVSLSLSDFSGRKIRCLASSMQPAGLHSVDVDVSDLEAGSYIMRMDFKGRQAFVQLIVI